MKLIRPFCFGLPFVGLLAPLSHGLADTPRDAVTREVVKWSQLQVPRLTSQIADHMTDLGLDESLLMNWTPTAKVFSGEPPAELLDSVPDLMSPEWIKNPKAELKAFKTLIRIRVRELEFQREMFKHAVEANRIHGACQTYGGAHACRDAGDRSDHRVK